MTWRHVAIAAAVWFAVSVPFGIALGRAIAARDAR